MKNVHTDKYLTNDVEVDVNEQLSAIDILKLLQRVTFAHSKIIGLDHQTMIDRDSAFWVVTKMKYVLNHPISANKKITLKTWTHLPQAVRFVRDLQIKEKNKLLVKAKSEWCCLDYKSRALRRSSSIKYPNLEMIETKDNNITFSNTKIDFSEKDFVYIKRIMPTDIDVNLHTNNLKYTVMAIDALSLQDLQNNFIKEYGKYPVRK